ncbi:MAG: hypothetical protein JNJ99_14355 [Crocinitomicaceae bacterium]|nr:hypothetical protein [Crocinitomicaceae bacterium]
MKSLLLKLKIIQQFRSELNFSIDQFVGMMKSKVDYSTFGFFSDATDVMSGSENDFKGMISETQFRLKHKRKMFSGNLSIPMVSGSVEQKGNRLEIKTEINAFQGPLKFLFFLVIISWLINLVLIGVWLKEDTVLAKNMIFPAVMAMIIFPLFVYLIMRLSVSGVKRKMEKHLFKLETN